MKFILWDAPKLFFALLLALSFTSATPVAKKEVGHANAAAHSNHFVSPWVTRDLSITFKESWGVYHRGETIVWKVRYRCDREHDMPDVNGELIPNPHGKETFKFNKHKVMLIKSGNWVHGRSIAATFTLTRHNPAGWDEVLQTDFEWTEDFYSDHAVIKPSHKGFRISVDWISKEPGAPPGSPKNWFLGQGEAFTYDFAPSKGH